MTSFVDVLAKGFEFNDDNSSIEDCIRTNGTCRITYFNSGLQYRLLDFKPTNTNYIPTASGKSPKPSSSSLSCEKTWGYCEGCKELFQRRIQFKIILQCYYNTPILK